ncbi:glycosyltransferase [Argonema galeatum]|uniref:glycosyltransferase n=1 Tax=Argonema galeatum TaxID=2942762 RepID=UPI0020127641|nr:glycosyltransferase [Argonema galeatum A003/A1]
MKVLHIIPSVSTALGGPTQVVLNLVKALRDCGVDAEIVTTNDNGATLLDVPLNQRIEYEQVPIWFLPRCSPPLKEFIFSPAITKWLWENIKNYDILDNHYLFSYASTCAGAIARWQNVPYTVRTMGQLAPWALAQSRLKKEIYTFLIERQNLNRAAAIHCTSNGEAEDVRNFGIQTPTVTLPLGVNHPVYWPQAKQKLREMYGICSTTPVVLFLSRLHYKKRPDLLVQALGKLAAKQYKFNLVLAGSGETDYLNYLKNLVSSLELTAETTFPGFVEGQDKELLLQGADIFVLPSFSENFGIAVAEALAHGLPVIITPDIQIAPEIAAAKAGLVVKGEVEPLADAIAQLLTSPQQRQHLGENGKDLVQRRYSWSAIGPHLADVYTSILDKQPIPQYPDN